MNTRSTTRRSRRFRLGAAVAVGTAAVLAAASVASAHVGLEPGEVAAGESALITFAFSHGCDGSATTEIRIQLPASIPTVAPTMNAGWDVAKVMEDLDAPITGAHGEQITQRVAEVVYTAKTPVPDGYRDALTLSVAVPDTPGETIYFPTIQTCEEGESAWIEIPAEGQDHDDLEAPAPSVEVVESTGGDGGHDDGADEDEAGDSEASSASAATVVVDSAAADGIVAPATTTG